MIRKAVEHSSNARLSNVQKWRVVPDQPGKMGCYEGVSIEPEDRQRYVTCSVIIRREPRFQPFVRPYFVQVLKGDANPCGHAEGYVFDPLSISRHLSVGIAEEESNPASVVKLLAQGRHKLRLIEPDEIIRVPGEEQFAGGFGDQIPPNRGRASRSVRIRTHDLHVVARPETISHCLRPQHLVINSQWPLRPRLQGPERSGSGLPGPTRESGPLCDLLACQFPRPAVHLSGLGVLEVRAKASA